MTAATALTPIFVLGTKGRSGTGYLSELLRLHPRCARPDYPLDREDWLLKEASLLSRYVSSISNRIHRARFEPRDVTGLDDRLLGGLGRGLLDAFVENAGNASHLVLKSPSLSNLDIGTRMFPRATFIVIIRNGRDSVESSLRSWPTERDGTPVPMATYARHWVAGVRRLVDAMETLPGRFMSLRYEDLLAEPERRLRQLFAFSGLAADDYPFADARELSLYGSSTHVGTDGQLTFRPLDKPAGFEPMQRAAAWTDAQHREFNAIAGPLMRRFGYGLVDPDQR